MSIDQQTRDAVDLGTELAGIRLPNPVLTAAGCAGTGRELEPFLDLAGLGGFVTRSVTLDPCAGTPMPRLVETPSGVLTGAGLQNPGLQGFLATELPWLAQRRVRVMVSIAGSTLGEYAELARRVGDSPGVSAVEVNLATGNRDRHGRVFGADAYQAGKVLAVVRRDVPRGVPVLAKLGVEAPDLVEMARAVVKAGADAVVLLNAVPGLVLDPVTLRPALGAVTGGLSGAAIHPLAVRWVWEVHRALPDVPLVGVGGVRTGYDALELLAAGARAIQVGSATFADPAAPGRILDELRREMADRNLTNLADLIGRAHDPEGNQP